MNQTDDLNVVYIRSTNNSLGLDWNELWRYRYMLFYFVLRNLRARYAQSAFGFIWAIIIPVVQMLVFTVIFGNLINVSSDGAPYAIFSFAALVPWMYFAQGVAGISVSLIGYAQMMAKVYYPRIIIPIAAAVESFTDFLISLGLLIVMLLLFRRIPTIDILFLPVLLLILIFTVVGSGLILATLAVQYRDVQHAVTILIRFLSYTTPVIYPLSIVPKALHYVMALNPMTGVIEGFRSMFLGTNPMPWDLIAISGTMSVVLLVIGYVLFQTRQHTFVDIA
jgi:lipopolysaccharide transport system permease protein